MRIEINDIVNVFFTVSSALYGARVTYVPCNIGEAWGLETIDIHNKVHLHYVLVFERMDLISKSEEIKNDDPTPFHSNMF